MLIHDEDGVSQVSEETYNKMLHALNDSTNFMIIVCALIFVMIVGLLALYAACCICSLRGDLDLVTDEETGRPLNRAFFVNPFKRRSKGVLPTNAE